MTALTQGARVAPNVAPDFGRWLWAQRLRTDAVGTFARNAADRRMRPEQVAAEMLIDEPVDDNPRLDYFHGGAPGLEVGTSLLPSAQPDHTSWLAEARDNTTPPRARPDTATHLIEVRDRIDPHHREFIYATTDRLLARHFAFLYSRWNPEVRARLGFGLYRVEMVGPVEIDPWRIDAELRRSKGFWGDCVRAPSARVVEVLDIRKPSVWCPRTTRRTSPLAVPTHVHDTPRGANR